MDYILQVTVQNRVQCRQMHLDFFHLFFNLSNVNIGLKRIYLSTQSDRFKTGKERAVRVRAKMCVKIIKGLISCITCLNECLCACFCEWRVFKHKIQKKVLTDFLSHIAGVNVAQKSNKQKSNTNPSTNTSDYCYCRATQQQQQQDVFLFPSPRFFLRRFTFYAFGQK